VYVQSLSFNGKPVQNCWMYLDELTKGGKLTFEMGSRPNQSWGTTTPPPSVQ
jgi:putative alpha-1,2-mannosidase